MENIREGKLPTTGLDAASLIHDVMYMEGGSQKYADDIMVQNLMKEYPPFTTLAEIPMFVDIAFKVKDLFGYKTEPYPQYQQNYAREQAIKLLRSKRFQSEFPV